MWVFQILNHMSDMKVIHCVLFGNTDQRGDSANSIHFVTSWRKSMKFPPRPWKFTSSKMVRRLFAKVIQMVPTAKFPRVTVRVAVVECPKFQEFQVPTSLWWRRESSVSWRIMLLTATLGQSLMETDRTQDIPRIRWIDRCLSKARSILWRECSLAVWRTQRHSQSLNS